MCHARRSWMESSISSSSFCRRSNASAIFAFASSMARENSAVAPSPYCATANPSSSRLEVMASSARTSAAPACCSTCASVSVENGSAGSGVSGMAPRSRMAALRRERRTRATTSQISRAAATTPTMISVTRSAPAPPSPWISSAASVMAPTQSPLPASGAMASSTAASCPSLNGPEESAEM